MSAQNPSPTSRRVKVKSLGHGRGSIWQRPDGTLYHIYMSNGRQHEVRLAARNKTEALREVTDRNVKRDTGRHVEPSRRTFDDVYAEFISVKRAALEEGRGSTRTVELYEQRYRAHIKPALGALQFQKITVAHLGALLSDLRHKEGRVKRNESGSSSKPLSAGTRDGILRLTSAVFGFGVRRGYRTDNPCQYLEPGERPGGKPSTKARALTDDECSRLISATRPGLRDFVTLLAFTGVRLSEGSRAAVGRC